MITIEEWRSVPSNTLLEGSSWGRVRSLPYESPMPKGGVKTNKMSATFGYKVCPTPNYTRMLITFRRKTYKVHGLIAEAFLGIRPNDLDVSHKNEDATDNRPINLEYLSRKDNLNKPKIKAYHSKACREKMVGNKILKLPGA